jgi:hypothetical protein
VPEEVRPVAASRTYAVWGWRIPEVIPEIVAILFPPERVTVTGEEAGTQEIGEELAWLEN